MDDTLKDQTAAVIAARLDRIGRAVLPAELGAAAAESALVGSLLVPFRERLVAGDAPDAFAARLAGVRDAQG